MKPEDVLGRLIWWASTRLAIGSWFVMIAAGMLHNDVHASFPAWDWIQSFDVAFALTVVGFFFRDQGQGFHKPEKET